MALKPTRIVNPYNSLVDYYWEDSTVVTNHGNLVQRGGIACYDSAAGSGVAVDQAENKVTYVADASGQIAVGVLMHDVVNYDLTQRENNPYQHQVNVGGKVELLQECTVTTDRIYPGHTPTVGGKAYLGHSGYIAASDVTTDHVDSTGVSRVVGRFASIKDEDGYCTVRVNLPNMNV